jgi:hypothetical protein
MKIKLWGRIFLLLEQKSLLTTKKPNICQMKKTNPSSQYRKKGYYLRISKKENNPSSK